MEITVIGSSTAAPDGERVCAAYYVEEGPMRLLFDCGAGAVHHLARFGAPWSRLTHVALTHFHLDHVGDLPMLLFALRYTLAEPRRDPLTIIGPAGTTALLDRLAEAHGPFVREPGFPLTIHELRDGDRLQVGDALLIAHATPHTEASLAYRLEAAGGVIGYTGDTGPSEALGHFLRGVDLLIAECSVPDDLAMDGHLSPTRVAELALVAEPRTLVTTHVYPALDPERVPELVREAGYAGPVLAARDGLRLAP